MADEDELFAGLQSLSDDAFPKRCSYCGRIYETSEQYVRETESLAQKSGLKAAQDDDGSSILELYRNCVCGSTLMGFYQDRRDVSERGLRRRETFGRLMTMLEKKGLSAEVARHELLELMRGNRSPLLEELGINKHR